MRDLRPLFDPRSVAILGASGDPAKWGQWLAVDALKGAHRRHVWLVNRNGGEILGQPAYGALEDVPGRPELVVVALPASAFEDAIDVSLDAGARAIVAITAGLGELDQGGRAMEHAVAERVRAAGAVMLGPNCLGVYDASAEFVLGVPELTPGSIGIISQSGNLAVELSLLAAEYGEGVARFASLGNQADLDAADLVEALVVDPATRVIAVYCEDFRDGRRFARAAVAALAAGKRVVLLAPGGSEAGARAAVSHTGAMVSDSAAIDAACRAAGIIRVATAKELADTAVACLGASLPRGRRLAIVGDGGGTGVVSADFATAAGLTVPLLSASLGERLRAIAPTIIADNPVDLAGAGEQDFANFERVTTAVLESGEVDAVVLAGYFGGYSQVSEEFHARETEVATALARKAVASGCALVVQAMFWESAPAWALRRGGIPVYRDTEAAVGTLARLAEQNGHGHWRVPDAGMPVAPPVDRSDYFTARELLAAAGIPFARACEVKASAEARDAASEIGYPVALKALGLLHKSDAGGVVLGIESPAALDRALAEMESRLAPPGFSVEQMVDVAAGTELIVGCRTDARFGPLVLVGLGGIFTEVLRDVTVALAPAMPDQLEELVLGLRGAGLLSGARGRSPLDVRAAAEVAARVSELACRHPEIAEIEINPLLVTATGAIALDARIVLAG